MNALRRIRSRAISAARHLVDIGPPRASLALVDAIEGRHGEPELRLLPALVRPGSTACDIGANRGVYARRLARLCPLVIAFEPQPHLASRLASATPDNVVVLPVALSGKAGEATLKIPLVDAVMAHTRATLEEADYEHTDLTVLRVRLDDLNLSSVGLMKIDVEGHEMDMLDGAMDTIERCRPRLIVECMSEMGSHPSEVATRLAPLGYEGWFALAGAILPISEFDEAVHQAHPKEFGGPRTTDQVTNFVFIPSAEAPVVVADLVAMTDH
jgi:FkbM family methyltransferase